MAVQLRDYQRESIAKIAKLYELGRRRVTLVLPCGTGKTVVAANLIPTGPEARTVVFVPTLALLAQTWAQLRAARPGVAMMAVCSRPPLPDDDADADVDDISAAQTEAAIEAPLSTDPDAVAAWMLATAGPQILVCTYASSPVAAAAAGTAALTFSLVVCDEAHRTAGAVDRVWSTPVHGVPAHRWLFMTATPRTVCPPPLGEDPDADTIRVISMDSVADYGTPVTTIGFREAIDAGWLSDYDIAVVAANEDLAWRKLVVSATESRHRPTYAATQLALLDSAATYDLRSILVFHNRIDTSRAWIEQLGKVANLQGRKLYAAHIDGGTDAAGRQQALDMLANPGELLVVVSNCRVFSEGVDVPALDAVMFAEPRTGGPDIIQIVGRAIRPHPHRPGRKAMIILPIIDHLTDPADIDTKAARAGYLTAWQVLAALAEEDELLHRSLVQLRGDVEAGNPPDPSGPVRIDPTALTSAAGSFLLKTIARTTSVHALTALQLAAFQANHGHTRPRASSPATATLANRVSAARAAHRAGLIHPRIVAQFEAIPGFSWDTGRTSPAPRRSVDEWIELVGRHIQETGLSLITRDTYTRDPRTGGKANIGNWIYGPAIPHLTRDELQRLQATGYRRFR